MHILKYRGFWNLSFLVGLLDGFPRIFIKHILHNSWSRWIGNSFFHYRFLQWPADSILLKPFKNSFKVCWPGIHQYSGVFWVKFQSECSFHGFICWSWLFQILLHYKVFLLNGPFSIWSHLEIWLGSALNLTIWRFCFEFRKKTISLTANHAADNHETFTLRA